MLIRLIEDEIHGRRVEENSEGVLTQVQSFITTDGLMSVIKSIDKGSRFGNLLHVSCAREDRTPNWLEVEAMKDLFFGEEGEAMILMTPKSQPIGFHPHCVHLWQLPEGWME